MHAYHFTVKYQYLSFRHLQVIGELTYGPRREKICLRGIANSTGADQPAQTRCLISACVIRFLENITRKLASGEFLIF